MRSMWVLALFDLPTETKANRKAYARFRNDLLRDGFLMMQFSVYVRACSTHEAADQHAQYVEEHLPPKGQVRVITLTSLQYARMKCFYGEAKVKPEKPPDQLSFF